MAGVVGELAKVVGADLGLVGQVRFAVALGERDSPAPEVDCRAVFLEVLGELRDVGSRDAELLAQALQFGANVRSAFGLLEAHRLVAGTTAGRPGGLRLARRLLARSRSAGGCARRPRSASSEPRLSASDNTS